MRTSTPPITQLDELKAYLGEGFIVLFGSAVSGVMRPALPMVDDVTRTFLQQAGAQLQAGTWLERVAAGYAIALAEGYHKDLRKSTKFENFIWRLQHFLGKKEIDTLLARVYGCTGKQYNLNHSALAFLLQERHCLACLTTNFDNALELCLPTLQLYIHPNRPRSLATERDAPILYKLHGDALAGSCVRTSPELSQAATQRLYSFLEELLRDYVVLVLGYSGIGDVDVSPHLGRHERYLLWCNKHLDEPNLRRHKKIDVICDLEEPVPGGEKNGKRNLLLELAASYGWKGTTEDVAEVAWKDEIECWTQRASPENLRDFIAHFMSWRTSWPHAHLAYYKVSEDLSYSAKLDYAVAATQVAAYNSSENALESLLLTPLPVSASYIETVKLLGFTYWRKGYFHRALSTFLDLLQKAKPPAGEWKTLDAESLHHIADTARHYLDTLIEMVYRYADNVQRQAVVRASQANDVVETLEAVQDESTYYLNQIAIREIRYWLGQDVLSAEIREFIDECIAMKEWEAAALATQFLLTLSLADGQSVVAELLPGLKERNAKKLIMKVRAKLRYEQLDRRIPLQLLNGRIFMGVAVFVTEFIFAIKRLIWKLDGAANRSRVETGFLSIGTVPQNLGTVKLTSNQSLNPDAPRSGARVTSGR